MYNVDQGKNGALIVIIETVTIILEYSLPPNLWFGGSKCRQRLPLWVP